MKIYQITCAAYFIASIAATIAIASSNTSSVPVEKKLLTPTNSSDSNQTLKQELEGLKGAVAAQERQLAVQQGRLDAYAKKNEINITPIVTAIGVVFAAVVGGFFAFRNQNKQAEQERLLKAVELIMESRSGFHAEIRRKNLEVFLDKDTNTHLKEAINRGEFAGPEFTELHVALAQAMSEKAANPEDVLAIWRSVLKGKKFFDKIEYLDSRNDSSPNPQV